jgi:glycosyltransferase involved in cell wall biosynthesis
MADHTNTSEPIESERQRRETKVSIGVPVYNGERFIRRAIESVLSQTFTDLELIISDNASVDGTQEICEHFAASDDRVRYSRQPTNVGALGNFAAVLSMSRSRYFSWLAHDDYYLRNDHVNLLVNELDRGTALAFPDTDIVVIDREGHVVSRTEAFMGDVFSDIRSPRALRKAILRAPSFPLYGMYNRAVLQKHIPRLQEGSDLRCFNEGLFVIEFFFSETCAFVPQATFVCIRHDENVSRSYAAPAMFVDYAKHTFRTLKMWYLDKDLDPGEKASLVIEIARIHLRYQAYLMLASIKQGFLGIYNRAVAK